MCHASIHNLFRAAVGSEHVRGKVIVETGALDVNGSVREYVMSLEPESYIATDMRFGPGVDLVCDVVDLVAQFGVESCDGVVSTEMLEHVEDWKAGVRAMKSIVRPGGWIGLTTRSVGFPLHGFPNDYWRFSLGDARRIFADFEIIALEPDPEASGLFVFARKPTPWFPANLTVIDVYSMANEAGIA